MSKVDKISLYSSVYHILSYLYRRYLSVYLRFVSIHNACCVENVTFLYTDCKFIHILFNSTIHTDQDNTSLIVSVAVPFTLLFVFCVVVSVLYVRRKRLGGRRTTKEARATDSMSLADSEVEINRPILIRNFADHYRLMSADSDFR